MSLLLALCIVLGIFSATVYATGTEDVHSAEISAPAEEQAVSVHANDVHTAHCVCGGKIDGHEHESAPADWQPWDGTGEIVYSDGSARVYLTKDVSANLTVPSGSSLTICLNGKAFRCADKSLAAITLENATLNLCDCVGTGTIGGRTSGEKGGSIQAHFSTVNLYGGTLTGNSGLGYGGGISFEGGTFSMHGGAIKGNSAQYGGGIFGGDYSSQLGGNAYAALAKDDSVMSITLKAAWIDVQKPAVSGIEDQKTYCGSVRFTVTDNDTVQKVYDRAAQTILTPENVGSYLLTPSERSYELEISDPAGNVTTLIVKINDGHRYGDWQTGDGMYWRVCSACGGKTEKKAVPTCGYQIASTICPQTDLVFTFTVPSGCTFETVGYDTRMRGSNISDSNLQRNQDGSYTATLHWSDFNQEGHVSVQIFAVTADGYTFITNLGEVTVLAEHPWGAWASNHDDTHSRTCTKDSAHVETKPCNGGEANCLTRATCADCGEPYGDLNPQNHVKGTDWVRTETTHEKKYLCCGEIVVEEEPHEWNNGICTECGYECLHSGGEATCVSPKECEICHEKYGEIDAHNHAELRHIETKEPTVKFEGNIKHWYCAACGKYYRDADLTQEIAKEDTVLPKLKPAVPATGDESGMGTWIIVLCISGSVLIVAAIILLCVLRKKRK